MNLLPSQMITNVLDLMKIDPQIVGAVPCANLQNFRIKNGLENCVNDLSQNNGVNLTSTTLENLLNTRSISNNLTNNSTLPLGAQIFTIPASLATFPNSDLIPVFVNSLGQMVLANTGNLLANSVASLATTLNSLQQLSSTRDTGLFSSNQSVPQNNGILDHLMMQYQQLHAMNNSVMQQSWANNFQQPQRDQSPAFTAVQSMQTPAQNHIRLVPPDKSNIAPLFPMPTSCSSSSLPSDKFHSTNVPSADYRASDNRSPSVCSSVSSRSVGNKINQMIDVSNDYILGQDDNLVKEKAAELMRKSFSQHSFNNNNNNNNESNRYIGSSGLSHLASLDRSNGLNIDLCQTSASMTVDGVDIGEIREFARNFKMRRLSMGLTQTQVGQALTAAEGPAYSQSAICRFEKLDITPKSAQKIKPILEKWISESEEKYRNGDNSIEEGSGSDINKKRKRRTSFTPQALEMLNIHFDKKSHPTGSEMRSLANELNYDREVIRVWFCNKRQALKNSIKKVKPSSVNSSSTITKCTTDTFTRQGNCDSSDMKLESESVVTVQSFLYKSEAQDLRVEKPDNDGRTSDIEEHATTIQCTE